jgi:hypothetical protein
MLVLVGSAMAAAASGARPTAVLAADLLWCVVAGVVVGLVASHARTWALVVLGGTAALLAGGWLALVALVSLALALGSGVRRDLWPRALVGAVGLNVLLRADGLGPSTWTAVLAVGAVGCVLVSGVPRLPAAQRTALLAASRYVGGAAILAVVAVALTLLLVQGDLDGAVGHAERGLELANDGDVDGAQEQFGRARDRFARSHAALSGWWLAPARVLPIVGPNLRATADLSGAGAGVSAAALTVAESADPNRLRVSDGSIDLTALSDTEDSLLAAIDVIDQAIATVDTVRSPWLLTPLANRIDSLRVTLADAADPARDLITIVRTAPAMLGAEGPRTYLILLTAPSETRGLGGFVGNYGLLVVDDGRIRLETVGRPDELPGQGERALSGPADYLARYYRYVPEMWIKNVTASPDFPTVAAVATELFAESGVEPIDGVIVADPAAIAALLSVTGPVELPDLPYPLDGDSVEQYLHTDQYFLFVNLSKRHDVLEELVRTAFDQLTTGTNVNPRALIDAFAPVVAERRLILWSHHEADLDLVRQVGLDGSFPRPGEVGDLISVRTANTNGNKIDAFLRRDISYAVDLDADGALTATAVVTLTNNAVDDPTWPGYVVGNMIPDLPRAWNYQWVSIYTPHVMTGLDIEGSFVDDESHEHIRELGWNVYSVYVKVPPQESVTVTLELEGSSVDPAAYRLRWSAQPTIHPDHVRLEVRHQGETLAAVDTTTSLDIDLVAHGRDGRAG